MIKECCEKCVIKDSVGMPIGCHDSNHWCPCHQSPHQEPVSQCCGARINVSKAYINSDFSRQSGSLATCSKCGKGIDKLIGDTSNQEPVSAQKEAVIAICTECREEFTNWLSDSNECPNCEGIMIFRYTLSKEQKKCCGRLPNGESWGHSGKCSEPTQEPIEEKKCNCIGGPLIESNMTVAYCRRCGNKLPTQEPMEWGESLEKFWKDNYGNPHYQAVSVFLSSQIKQAEEIGYSKGFDAGGQTKGGTGRIMYQRGLEEGKLQHNQDCTREEWARGDERKKIFKEIATIKRWVKTFGYSSGKSDGDSGQKDEYVIKDKDLQSIITNQ